LCFFKERHAAGFSGIPEDYMMFSVRPEFVDRRDAGRRLASQLSDLAEEAPIVLALPRGGVPVAYEIAKALKADLDLLFVRKLGAPGHEELGIGAIVDGADPHLVLNEDIVKQMSPGPKYIAQEKVRQLKEIERRRRVYLGDRAPVSVQGRTVILVDDGIATGGTIRAALKGVRLSDARRIILAVPVGPGDIIRELASECEDFVCLYSPDPFYAVGAHYEDFAQIDDAEVVSLLAAAQHGSRGPDAPSINHAS
jgi:putative phosphoribosyl transferase